MAVGVEETAGQLLRYFEGGRFSQESDLRIGGDAFGSGENLEGDEVSLGADHLGQLAAYNGQFVIAHAAGAKGHRGLGDAFQLGIDFLICFVHKARRSWI